MLCEISFALQTFIGQFLALLTFFAFPAIQYIIVKRFSRKQGMPELWYLPSFGFRLVIRNIPNKRILSDIKSKIILRETIESNFGSSVATYQDKLLIEREELFLFPGIDQILINFKVVGRNKDELKFALTDKLGNIQEEFPLANFDSIISDYTANVENFLNFNKKLGKSVSLTSNDLIEYWK